jgi:hypothetical protein
MTFKNQAGIGVSQNYGPRNTGSAVGLEDSDGSIFRLSVNLTGNTLNDLFLPPVVIPKGAKFRKYELRVDEAFALGGTSPTVQIGAFGAPGTNGVVITQAELQAVGTKELSTAGAGTWAQNSTTGTTAAAKVAVALGGTSPTATTAGKAILVLEFFSKAKA